MTLNIFAILNLITAISCFLLTVILYFYGHKKIHTIWSLFNLSAALWAFFAFLASITDQSERAYDYWRLSHALGIYTATFFLHAVCIFCNIRLRKTIKLAYFYGPIFGFFTIWRDGHFMYKGTQYLFGSIHYLQIHTMQFYSILSFWLAIILLSIILLLRYFFQNKDQQRLQALWWAVFTILGYIGALLSFLPYSGILIYPYAMILVPIYVFGMTYAICRKYFMDISIVLEKGVVYSVSITLLTVGYLTNVMLFERFFQTYLGYGSFKISIISAFIIGLLFIPLRDKFQKLIDRVFYKGSQEEIAKQNEMLIAEVAHSEKYKTLATLMNGIIHEIKDPLTAIKGYSYFLEKKKDDKEFIEKFTGVMNEEVQKIDDVISHINDYCQPIELNFENADINQLCIDSLALLKNDIVMNKIQIEKEFIANGAAKMNVDQNKIRQAILNVLLNAIESMPQGGTISVQTEYDKNDIQLKISDTGYGIKKDEMMHIYDPFFSKKENHSGLGLSIAQNTIQNHHGRIIVESKTNQGTEITICLPVKVFKNN